MKTKNIINLNREACLSLPSQVHCGKIQCKHGCRHLLCEKRQKEGNQGELPARGKMWTRGFSQRHHIALLDMAL